MNKVTLLPDILTEAAVRANLQGVDVGSYINSILHMHFETEKRTKLTDQEMLLVTDQVRRWSDAQSAATELLHLDPDAAKSYCDTALTIERDLLEMGLNVRDLVQVLGPPLRPHC